MKTIKQITELYVCQTMDGRDISRLTTFLTEDQIESFGMVLKPEYAGKHAPVPFTREAVLEQLCKDVEFGFEKALGKRGISAGMMFDVVSMWNWILEEGLEGFETYAQYGLPLFKATAVKYGFENPIGADSGDEHKYSSEG